MCTVVVSLNKCFAVSITHVALVHNPVAGAAPPDEEQDLQIHSDTTVTLAECTKITHFDSGKSP